MVRAKIYQTIQVKTNENIYPVFVGYGLLQDRVFIQKQLSSDTLFIVSNETVAPLYLEQLQQTLKPSRYEALLLKDGEAYKNQQSLQAIYDKLIAYGYHRDSCLLALGGGVIGDIGGFAASTFQRGMPYIQIPTTLLAQVDASVGGKTAINHPEGKNMIGSFYQPKAVIADLKTLETLPDREFKAGMAEVIKYAWLQGEPFFSELKAHLKTGINANTPEILAGIVAACCRMKAEVIAKDEKEQGVRALLNLGHTFAHALEALSEYRRWLHGEAVAIGLYCAASLSETLGFAQPGTREVMEEMLKDAGLPYRIPEDIDVEQLCVKMKLDKKIKNNRLVFILIKKPGLCVMSSEVSGNALRQTMIDAYEGETK